MNRYHLIVQHYLKIGDYNSLINTCKRLGKVQPCLWLQALTGLRDDEKAPVDLLQQVLNVIGMLRFHDPLMHSLKNPTLFLILSFLFRSSPRKAPITITNSFIFSC